MVYTELYILVGIPLTIQQLKILLPDLTEEDDVTDQFDEHYVAHEEGKSTMKLFSYPCCSESNGLIYILGYEVHRYYRKYVQCKNCEEHSVCDICIGETTGGYYDVSAIHNGLVSIPPEKICQVCHSDKVDEVGKCRLCFMQHSNPKKREEENADKSPEVIKALEKRDPVMLKSYEAYVVSKMADKTLKPLIENLDTNPRFYYFLNDCLNCS